MAVSECIRRLRLSRSGMPISAVICCVPVGEWSTWLDSLHPCELEQLGRARSDKRRAEFVSGRHAAKRAICSLACSTSWLPSLLIESGVFGQPVVRAEVAAQVGVSIAHSGDFAIALAFDSGHPMGVDLEMCTAVGPRDGPVRRAVSISTGDECASLEREGGGR